MNEHILAISWNIATEPKLYRELATNPYSNSSAQIISTRFPGLNTADIIQAVVLAEPEGSYDRFFKKLPPEQQPIAIDREANITAEITRQLNQYYSQHALKLIDLSPSVIYDMLYKTAFGTVNIPEVEQRFSQNQRKSIKLLILDFLAKQQTEKLIVKQGMDRKKFSTIAIAVLFSISFFCLIFIAKGKPITVHGQAPNTIIPASVVTQKPDQALPVRLKIPSIHVDTTIEEMGLTSDGAMDVPSNTVDVGWYKLGTIPGEKGSAVIAGHFDPRIGEIGVFNNLDQLKPGDKIYIENNKGGSVAFTVRESRSYDPGYADDVFNQTDGAHLNLITCNGPWNSAKKIYSKRLVVFADLL